MDSPIIAALKSDMYNLRVVMNNGVRWVIWDGGEWVVYEHKYRGQGARVIERATDEAKAVEALTGEK